MPGLTWVLGQTHGPAPCADAIVHHDALRGSATPAPGADTSCHGSRGATHAAATAADASLPAHRDLADDDHHLAGPDADLEPIASWPVRAMAASSAATRWIHTAGTGPVPPTGPAGGDPSPANPPILNRLGRPRWKRVFAFGGVRSVSPTIPVRS